METWQVWFSDGRVEEHSGREQLSVEEMEAIIGGWLDLQPTLSAGEYCDMVLRWDADEQKLPVNERATAGWRSALQQRGLKSLRSEVIRGDVIVLGYPLLRREIAPDARLDAIHEAAKHAVNIDFASLDRAAIELVLGELLDIDRESQRTGYRPAVENAVAQYRAVLSRMAAHDDAEASGFET
jgi:hypothetical protein